MEQKPKFQNDSDLFDEITVFDENIFLYFIKFLYVVAIIACIAVSLVQCGVYAADLEKTTPTTYHHYEYSDY